MAEPVGKAVLDVVQNDCKSLTCPYRKGDGDSVRHKFKTKIEKKLEYRVADGNAVRARDKRILQLEVALEKVYEKALRGDKLSPRDLTYIREVLKPKKDKA